MPKTKDFAIVEKAKAALFSPAKFFPSVRKEKLKQPFIFLAITSLVTAVIGFAVNIATTGALAFLTWVIGLILSFIVYGFFHLFVLLFGGKEGYENTYKAFAYGATPSSLLGWLPPLFLFAGGFGGFAASIVVMAAIMLWSLYITLRGLSVLQKMSMLRALAAVAIAVIIILAALLAIFTWAFLAFYPVYGTAPALG